jgi:hypothetical protein
MKSSSLTTVVAVPPSMYTTFYVGLREESLGAHLGVRWLAFGGAFAAD